MNNDDIQLSRGERVLFAIWGIIGTAIAIWIALEGIVVLVKTFRAEDISKLGILRGAIAVFGSALVGIGVYFGGIVICVFVYRLVEQIILAWRHHS